MALTSSLKIDQWSIFKAEVNEYREKKLAIFWQLLYFSLKTGAGNRRKKLAIFWQLLYFSLKNGAGNRNFSKKVNFKNIDLL